MDEVVFRGFPKIARLTGDMVITEKIDGTNAAIGITDNGTIWAQSRSRIITPDDDNFGFAAWVYERKEELLALGPGLHFGEWWGQGIQRNYGLKERRFSLFNTNRDYPECCHAVPVLYYGPFTTELVDLVRHDLLLTGSLAAPGFPSPEGVMVRLNRPGIMLKYPFDHTPKGTK